jgi:hypothetical protein
VSMSASSKCEHAHSGMLGRPTTAEPRQCGAFTHFRKDTHYQSLAGSTFVLAGWRIANAGNLTACKAPIEWWHEVCWQENISGESDDLVDLWRDLDAPGIEGIRGPMTMPSHAECNLALDEVC